MTIQTRATGASADVPPEPSHPPRPVFPPAPAAPPAPPVPVPVPAVPAPAAVPPGGPATAPPEADERTPPWRAALAVALPPALLTLLLCLYGIGDRQLWRDEHASWWAASLSWSDLGALTANMDLVLAPYYVLLHLWTAVAGDSEAALRLPSAFAMSAAAGGVALLGRRLLSPRSGLLGGLLFAVCPAITWYGQDARPYAFAVLAAVGSTLWLTRLVQDRPAPAAAPPAPRAVLIPWAGYGLTVAAMGLTHVVTLMVLPGHLLLVVREFRRAQTAPQDDGTRWVLPGRWALAAAGAVLLLSPLLLLGAGQSAQIAWNARDWDDLGALVADLTGSAALGWTLLVLGVLGAVSLLVLRQRAGGLLICWALAPVLVTLVTAHWLHLFLARYLLFTVPAWALLGAEAVGRLPGLVARFAASGTPPRRLVGPAPLVVAVALAAALAWPAQAAVRHDLAGEADARAAARLIAEGLRPGDGVVYEPGSSLRRALAYELRGRPAPGDSLLRVSPERAGSFGALECEEPARCLAGTRRVWLLLAGADRRPFGAVPDRVAKELNGFRQVRTETVPHLRVVLLERKPGSGG
ncbi:glycosyltransferase family 39 protein [Kitasatospora sp. NPDC056327]|uniref:glycosyltransferase family 39 protein n=1 Tax=Kitasatospora sp. NPDC056327 TaxID=3345785 RepID=UPI0035DEC09B